MLKRSPNSDKKIETLLSNFHCKKNKDVERFLINNAIRFEKADKCRTYLIVPSDKPIKSDGTLKILGYVSIAKKTMQFPQQFSNSKRKRFDGIDKKAEEVNTFLIGQLGKNDDFKNTNEEIKGNLLLKYALNLIFKCYEIIGGRTVLVECSDCEKVTNFYKENGFEFVNRDKKTGLLQFILNLDNSNFKQEGIIIELDNILS